MSNVPMTRPEEAISIQKHDWGHSASFIQLDDGRIMATIGGGQGYSEDGGLTWTIQERRDARGQLISGQSLVKLGGSSVGLMGLRDYPNFDGYSAYQALFYRSDDAGRTWSEPVVCNPPCWPAHVLQDVMIRTSSGRILFPVYMVIGQGAWRAEDAPIVGGYHNGRFVSNDAHYYDPHMGACYVCYSDDQGRTWKVNRDGQLIIPVEYGNTYSAVWEPSITEVSPNKLLMIMRTGLGRLFQAWSQDNGATWTRPQPTALAADHSPGQIRTMPNGDLLCVWTQQGPEEIKHGYSRTRLSSAISRNGGGIWEFFQNVESLHEETFVAPGPIEPVRPVQVFSLPGQPAVVYDPRYAKPFCAYHGRWSYPSVGVLKDRVLISHTYGRHSSDGRIVNDGGGSRLKILPLGWFYGGQVPTEESVYLRKASQAPTP